MISLDTNVLVRYLVRDDIKQAEAARDLLEGLTADNQAFVCREVTTEMVWVLERAYRFSREQIADILLEMLATDGLYFEAAEDVTHAAESYRMGGADFADQMILRAADRNGAMPLYTFDRKFSRMYRTILLESLTT